MSFQDDMKREMERISKERDDVLQSAALELYTAVVEASPVDTEELKSSWELPVKVDPNTYVIRNIAPHGIIIDGGRRVDSDGVMRGSEQLPNGYGPIVKQFENRLNRMLK